MKLVKNLQTGDYSYIDDAVYTANSSIYADYTDLMSYWDLVGSEVADIWTTQDNIKRLYTNKTWANLDDIKKDICIKYGVGDAGTEIIPYLMTVKGMTQTEAQLFYVKSVGNIVKDKAIVARKRADDGTLATIVYSFLDPVDADGLLNATFNFFMLYKEKVYLGTMYGDNSDGIMDFIENTGSYASSSTTGLNKYPILADVVTAYGDEATARAAFRQQLVDWLLHQMYNGQYVKL